MPILNPRYLSETTVDNFREHLELYNLPYGVLGVVSHGLTFWVILCHIFGIQPLMPWKRLESRTWNLVIVLLSSVISTSLACVALSRTRGSAALVTLAGMQIALGILLDIITILRAMAGPDGRPAWISLWSIPLLTVSCFSIYSYYQFPRE
jgi:hypothetical protein